MYLRRSVDLYPATAHIEGHPNQSESFMANLIYLLVIFVLLIIVIRV